MAELDKTWPRRGVKELADHIDYAVNKVGIDTVGVASLGEAIELEVAIDYGEVAEEIGQSMANTSHHLRTLARAGLVRSRQEGRYVIYSADFAGMNALVGFLTENCCGGAACAPRRRAAAKA